MIKLSSIRAYAKSTPDRTAIWTGARSISWHEFLSETEVKIRFLLKRYGNKLPTQACYISENRPELISWLAAFSTLNIPITGLDYTLASVELKKLLKVLQADFILIPDKNYGQYQTVLELKINSSMIYTLNSAEIDDKHDNGETRGEITALLKNLSSIPFRSVGLTSGTTGIPKVVIRNKSFDQRRFAFFIERYDFNCKDRFLVSMPLYHAAGNGWARMFMNLGATIYLAEINNPIELTKTIEQQRITTTVMTPSTLSLLLDIATTKNKVFNHSLKWLLVGGNHFPAQQKKRALKQLGPVVHEYYGTTETGVNTIAEPHDIQTHPQSVGRPFDGNEITIIDHESRPLDREKIGTVAIASYMNMDNYSDHKPNWLNIDGKKYLRTSEKGYIDKSGRLYLLNRSSSTNNHGNVFKLEDDIRDLPCITDVALILSETGSGSKITCAIELKHQANDASKLLHDIIKKLTSMEHMELLQYRIVSKIPYSPSGKVKIKNLELLLSAPQ